METGNSLDLRSVLIDNKLKKFILKEANDRCKGTLVSTLDINFTDVGETFLVAEMQVTPKLHHLIHSLV